MERFSEDHEYVRVEGNVGTVGITDHAQEQLGDVVFVELPDVGKEVKKGDEVGVIESVKAASEIYAPVSGKVVEVNDALNDNPSLINEDAGGKAWIFKVQLGDPTELEGLMDKAAYDAMIA